MKNKNINTLILSSFLHSILLLGYTLEDYGVNVEEHTQIYSGFYWLNFIFEYLNINFLKASLNEILQNISTDIYLPNPEYFTYGPIFDVPTAFLDLLFGSDKLTYLLNFVIFLFFFILSGL